MRNINKKDEDFEAEMKDFADAIELYIDELENVMIIPKDIMDKEGDKILANIELAKKLVRKIRKGKRNIFKDPDEWDFSYYDEEYEY